MSSPIAQTFYVYSNYAQGQEGIFLTRLDLYFKRKDPVFGFTLELRTTNNGFPSKNVIPFSRKSIPSAQVAVSNNASAVTMVTFDAPVFLKAGTEYAFVIIPDGNSPEYLIWTAEVGSTDVLNPNYNVRNDWGEGVMFTSTNDSTWTPIQTEDIKFTMHRADFTSGTGSITLTNKDDEFLTISDRTGSFLHGESVVKFTNTKIAGTVAFNRTSSVVTGTGTSFQTIFTPGAYIVLHNYFAPTAAGVFDVMKISAIANNTSLTVQGLPRFAASGVCVMKTAVGQVTFTDESNGKVFLTDSTATANSKFEINDLIIGGLTGAKARIKSVDDELISYFQPLIYRTNVTGTSLTANVSLMDTEHTIRNSVTARFNDSNFIDKYDALIASKSNEITAGGSKSFTMPINFSTASPVVSPTLDLQSTSILRYTNLINADLTDETRSGGKAVSKYVSKTITLADGLDAEDLQVYLTSYEPAGTVVAVFARLLNAYDPEDVGDKIWTRLVKKGNVKCDPANRNDFKEFVFTLPDVPPATTLDGVVSGANAATTMTGLSTLFDDNLANNDTIAITTSTGQVVVSKVVQVVSNTSITIANPLPFAVVGANVSRFDDAEAAFRDAQNTNVASYYSETAKLQTYKSFAIKIVLLSPSSYLVPRVKDVRALALTV